MLCVIISISRYNVYHWKHLNFACLNLLICTKHRVQLWLMGMSLDRAVSLHQAIYAAINFTFSI